MAQAQALKVYNMPWSDLPLDQAWVGSECSLRQLEDLLASGQPLATVKDRLVGLSGERLLREVLYHSRADEEFFPDRRTGEEYGAT